MVSLPEVLAGTTPSRKSLPRGVREEHQRERVIAAAVDVFAKRGYPAATVEDLTDAAQIGVGTFYALFGGKEGCMLRTYDRVVADARASVLSAVGGGRTWADRVCLALRAVLSLVAEQPLAARIALIEVQTAGPEALHRYSDTIGEVVRAMRRGRAEYPASESLTPTLEEATVTGIAWLLHQRLAGGQVADVEGLFPELAQMILEPYLGREEALRLVATAPPLAAAAA
jgi:AcrR family transcriptional regulator